MVRPVQYSGTTKKGGGRRRIKIKNKRENDFFVVRGGRGPCFVDARRRREGKLYKVEQREVIHCEAVYLVCRKRNRGSEKGRERRRTTKNKNKNKNSKKTYRHQ